MASCSCTQGLPPHRVAEAPVLGTLSTWDAAPASGLAPSGPALGWLPSCQQEVLLDVALQGGFCSQDQLAGGGQEDTGDVLPPLAFIHIPSPFIQTHSRAADAPGPVPALPQNSHPPPPPPAGVTWERRGVSTGPWRGGSEASLTQGIRSAHWSPGWVVPVRCSPVCVTRLVGRDLVEGAAGGLQLPPEPSSVPQFLLCARGSTVVSEAGVRAPSRNTQMVGWVQGCGGLGILAGVRGRSRDPAPPTPLPHGYLPASFIDP